ncbi:unnamed protein product (macronuclear) [Paramecium tetraurelia]|uniref:ALMS motif domain-containing protein n=1 Tax=Paramecium tetraurelia TaxID=5888 RepID=A0C817_PARTE|nr:uncharacterized protein GSPATT00036065001 [Paramecium tetraurelia]CAK66934.1 unnamed protein product [Paramecium tetraurelia]|eukprot:XP_001434331.1 hypothetical protein (macronuclear) [Paramecium tetraurelia strain d4-2]
MFYADSIQEDKIKPYLRQIEKEQERKDRIKNLAESLMNKTKLKLKLTTKESKREEQFNKKLEDMKQLSTFVDARSSINRLNLLNDRSLLLKLQVIKKTQKYQESNKNTATKTDIPKQEMPSLNSQPLILDDEFKLQFLATQNYDPIKRKQLQMPRRSQPESPKDTEPMIRGEEFLNFEVSPKNDTNLFYRSVFKTSPSPERKQLIQQYEEETKKARQFLQQHGLIEKQGSKNHKRSPLRKVPIQQYYQNFQKQCQSLVKDVALESRRRSVMSQMNESEGCSSKKDFVRDAIIHKNQNTIMCRSSMKLNKSQTNSLSSPRQKAKIFNQKDKQGSQTQRVLRKTRSIFDSEQNSPIKSRLQTQFESFTQAVNKTQKAFNRINKGNEKIIRRMSTAVSSIHKKYSKEVVQV